MLLHAALFSALFALQPPPGGLELDALPESLRARATLIFASTYSPRHGAAVRRGDTEVFPLIPNFNVKATYLGHVPENAQIDLTGHDLESGRSYLVLLRPEPDSWRRIEAGERTELAGDEIVSVVYLPPHAERVSIIDYGIFGDPPRHDRRVDAPNTSLGYLHVVPALETPAVAEHTEIVQGATGTRFGLLFCAEGETADSGDDLADDIAPIHIRVLHPETRNPVTGQATDHDEWDAPANLGIVRFTGWRFDADWEIVPGTWTIEILQNCEVMARKEFLVTKGQ